MITFYPILEFVILLTIPQLYKVLSYNTEEQPSRCRNRNDYRDRLDAFDDMGFVRIEESGKPYIVNGSQIIVEGFYTDAYANVEKMNVQTKNSSDQFSRDMSLDDILDELLARRLDDEINPPIDLKVLSLERSELHNLSSNTFTWLSNSSVQFLNLRNTIIKIAAEDILEPLQGTLKVLDLANTSISEKDLNALMKGLTNDNIESHSSLIILSLAHLDLKSVPYEALKPVQYSLTALSLFGNKFHSDSARETEVNVVDDYEEVEFEDYTELRTNDFRELLKTYNTSTGSSWASFPQMPYLVELDLRECNIETIERGSFNKLGNLRKLFISRNNILVLQNFAFQGLRNLAVLDISLNKLSSVHPKHRRLLLRSYSFAHLHSLKSINFSSTALHRVTARYLNRLPKSLHTVNLCQTKLSHLNDEIFSELKYLRVLDISNNFGLGSDLTTATFKGLSELKELYMSRTTLQSLTALETLSSLRILDVRCNNIDSLADELQNMPCLEYLDVSYNYINSWRGRRAFGKNPKLRALFLHFNILSLMSDEMLEDFKSLSYLTLGNNNFVCNCQLKDFMEYLIAINENTIQNLPILIDYQSKSSTHSCMDVSLSKAFFFEDTDDFCVEGLAPYWLSQLQHAVYITVLVILCCLSTGGLIYWKWWYIRYVAVLIKNATVLSMINVKNCEDRIYTYDIFVSFSDENRNWVIEELLPNIEGPEAKFSICLHERDFQVGVSILENIIMGMDQSRTILLIISGCFLKSQWCQFEMHLAQHRLLETCREELVLILLEEIPKRKRPKILRYLMMVKTYIVWPKDAKDSAAKKLFWKRLKRAITAGKSNQSSVA